MTHREKEILNWIEENPMISQQELADKAGITRSSVAVHISNLMKKGFIRGKGYVVQDKQGVVVVGAVNMDIYGMPTEALIQGDSNPGVVQYSLGGVGRNIAHNLIQLTGEVKLVTVFGEDIWADKILSSCKELGMDTSWSEKIKSASTSTYLFITDNKGEMVQAISHMDIYKAMTPEYMTEKMAMINKQELIICDTNIPEETLEYIADNAACPLFVDTVSTAKAVKVKDILSKIHCLKPNKIEAELLTGVKIVDQQTLELAGDKLLAQGLKQVFISMGSQGVYYASCSERGMVSTYKTDIVNSTGCGDAFMAAVAWAYLEGYDIRTQAECGQAAAALCISDHKTVSEKVNRENIQNLINKIDHIDERK